MKKLTTLFMFVVAIVYSIVGAFIFRHLEADNEEQVRTQFYNRLNAFLGENNCINETDVVYLDKLYQKMFVGGVSLKTVDGNVVVNNGTRWDYFTSIFVAVQLIGTIGFPRASPKTTNGRVFTLFYAFIGIPLFFLSAIGFGQLLSFGADLVLRLIARCRYGRRRENMDESTWIDIVYGRRRRQLYRTLLIAVVGTALFVLIPSRIFEAIEGWSYGEALYFCFTSLVTIGFGDFVPGYDNAPAGLGYGWYRLAIASWFLIAVGWFVGTATVIKMLATKLVEKVERTVGQMTDYDSSNQPQKPNYVVSRSGKTTSVQVQGNQRKLPFWKRRDNKTSSSGEVTAVKVRTRATSREAGVTSPSNALSRTSVIKIGS